jgi:hypothetical protein
MVAIDAEMKAETEATGSVETAQMKTLTASVTGTTTAAIAEDDRETAQGKGTDHDLRIPND